MRRITGVAIYLVFFLSGEIFAVHAADPEYLHHGAAGEGTRDNPWVGWEAAFQNADTAGRNWIVRPGHYEAPDTSTLLRDGTQLRCESGAVFQFTRDRSKVNAMFSIPAGSKTIEISGCGFEPNTTVPAVGLKDGTGGRSYIEVGSQGHADQAERIRIVDNTFGVMRYAGGGTAQGSVWIWSGKDILIHGNFFDAGKNSIGTPRGSDSTLYRHDDIVIADNVFRWSIQSGNQGAAIFFGARPTDGPIKAVFQNVTVSDNEFFNVDGGLYFASAGNTLSITGNTARSRAMDHFFFRESSSLIITDVLISNNVTESEVGSAAIKADNLRHASIRGNNVFTKHNSAAITVFKSEDVTVDNNYIDRGAVGFFFADCFAVGRSSRVAITSNQGVDCSTKGISLFPPLAEIIISDNMFFNSSEDLVFVIHVDSSCVGCGIVEINNQVTGTAASGGFTNDAASVYSFARRLWPRA